MYGLTYPTIELIVTLCHANFREGRSLRPYDECVRASIVCVEKVVKTKRHAFYLKKGEVKKCVKQSLR